MMKFAVSAGILLKAIHFAADKHRDQRRKGAYHAPYINHLIEVAEVLWETGKIRDSVTLVAAVLHDTIEDTTTTPEEIQTLFGEDVLAVVLEVTDDRSLPKAERKRLQVEHATKISSKARAIKLADKLCNMRDLIKCPPQRWPLARRQKYLLWSEQVICGLRGTNLYLERQCDAILEDGKKVFSIE